MTDLTAGTLTSADMDTATAVESAEAPMPTETPTPDKWRQRIAASREYREKKITEVWRENVNYRVQRPYGAEDDGGGSMRDKLSSPEDWTRTKQKTAQLMYQVPKILAQAGRPELEPLVPVVTAAINDVLTKECKAAYVLDENLADIINAAGIMAAVVGIDQRFEAVEVPGPEVMVRPAQALPDGTITEPLMEPGKPMTIQRLVSQTFTLDRISPAMFLWPPEFRGSDWDKAPWSGYDTWMAKPNVVRTWKLTPAQAEKLKPSSPPELLSSDIDDITPNRETVDYIRVTVIWARASEFDDTVAHPDCFKRIVFVDGLDEPVENDKTKWQQWVPEQPGQPASMGPNGQPTPPIPPVPGHYVGITKSPIRVATLTYVSDLSVPPSDSEAGRPQIREMIRGRSQMIRQRDSSIPIRWMDVNRIDDDIAEALKMGTWQDIIPMNGPGNSAIGEVARASFPRENFEFQSIITRDLDRAWALSNNQLGSSQSGRRSAKEIETIQESTDIRLDYEKAKVSRYVVGIAEVLFGLMQMFMDTPRYVQIVGQQGADIMTKVDKSMLAGPFAFDFLLNSSDRVDINARLRHAKELYNLAANSPTINRQALEREIIEMHGFDPAKVQKEPPPPKEEPPNVSYRFSGEDLLNPMAAAILLKTGHINADDIAAAAKMIQDAMRQAMTPQTLPQAGPGGGPAAPQPGAEMVKPPVPPEPITKRLQDGTRIG